jgi:hypothetical protein
VIDLAALERAFDDALAATIPNPVALIFSDLPLGYQGKRDLVFAMGLLNEGENECALIAGFIRDRLADDANADVTHMLREAWYYLRTSIDATWQFDDGEPSLPAAIAYLIQALDERIGIARSRTRPPEEPDPVPDGAERLQRLRAEAVTRSRVLP